MYVDGARAVEALRAVLPAAADVRQPRSGDHGSDIVVAGRALQLKWVGEGTLRRIREVLASSPRPDVVVARRLSPGAKAVLSEAGVGWVDETGAAEIAVGSIIVSRTGRVLPEPERLPRWTPSVIGVAEALLTGVAATVAATEAATGYSTGACTKALATLVDLGLLEAPAARGPGSARQVADSRALLDAYRAAASSPSPLELPVGVVWDDPVRRLRAVGREWQQSRVTWAVTGATAADVIAPFLGTVATATVYVDASTPLGLEDAAQKAGLNPLEGGRLTLRPFPTVATKRLAEQRDGLWVAPWPRVYVDLALSGVRGEEAAEHLLEVVGVA